MIENVSENPTDNQINSPPVVPTEKNVRLLKVIIVVTAFLLIGAGGFFLSKVSNKPKACTQEARVCPDGSTVGRIGPNCEFAPCSTQTLSPTSTVKNISTKTPDYEIYSEKTGWTLYKNYDANIEFAFPDIFSIHRDNYTADHIFQISTMETNEKDYLQRYQVDFVFEPGVSDPTSTFDERGEYTKIRDFVTDSTKGVLYSVKFSFTGGAVGGPSIPLPLYHYYAFWVTNNNLYQLHISSRSYNPLELFDQILSTFRFD